MQYSNKNEWLEAAQEAATGMIAGDALRIVRTWQEWAGQPIELPAQDQYLEYIRQSLLLTAFTVLGDSHIQYALKNLTTQFLLDNEDQLPVLQKIEDRISAAGTGLYDEERLKILQALEESQARLGGLGIQEWLTRFDGFRSTRGVEIITEFLLVQKELESSSSEEKKALKNLLEIYESYLRYPVITMDDYLAFQEEQRSGTQSGTDGALEKSGSVARVPLLKALSEYPNLGNQNISQERIRIKSQPEPVRGSLYNWIKYYRDELGIGQHSTVERGQFLFRSLNGKALSTIERERVNLILKSLEENLPIEIDTERQEIIFPAIEVEQSSFASASVPPSASIPQVVPLAQPTPKPFVPQPVPSSQQAQSADMASKFQPSPSPYQKMAIPPEVLSPDRAPFPGSGIDVSQMAEKLKREPKPEWIKGAFTKDSIPESAPIAQATGAMSFSFNHALPAEQEASPEQGASAPIEPARTPGQGVPPAPKGSSQFHIRPVSRRDQ